MDSNRIEPTLATIQVSEGFFDFVLKVRDMLLDEQLGSFSVSSFERFNNRPMLVDG
jgi:hypothetical protein